MITVVFRRVSRNLSWPIPGGGFRTISAFSEVRNELTGERPDPSRLPDLETGISSARTLGPIVMPRRFPMGAWEIYGIEKSIERWTSPSKILTRAHQPVPIWKINAKGEYDSPAGTFFDDWAYWIHYCNGSHKTDGCCGVATLSEYLDFEAMVERALYSKIPIQVSVVDE